MCKVLKFVLVLNNVFGLKQTNQISGSYPQGALRNAHFDTNLRERTSSLRPETYASTRRRNCTYAAVGPISAIVKAISSHKQVAGSIYAFIWISLILRHSDYLCSLEPPAPIKRRL